MPVQNWEYVYAKIFANIKYKIMKFSLENGEQLKLSFVVLQSAKLNRVLAGQFLTKIYFGDNFVVVTLDNNKLQRNRI